MTEMAEADFSHLSHLSALLLTCFAVIFFPCQICTRINARTHTHTHTPLVRWPKHIFFFLLSFQNFPSFPYPHWQHKVGLRFWLTTTTDTPPPLPLPSPPPPRFNPLPIPLSLPPSPFPLLFWVTLESRHVSIFSISDCLISRRWHPQLYWHRWWRSRLEQRGGEKKNGWLVFVVVTFPSHLFSGLFVWTLTPQADTDTLLTLMPVKATYGG